MNLNYDCIFLSLHSTEHLFLVEVTTLNLVNATQHFSVSNLNIESEDFSSYVAFVQIESYVEIVDCPFFSVTLKTLTSSIRNFFL